MIFKLDGTGQKTVFYFFETAPLSEFHNKIKFNYLFLLLIGDVVDKPYLLFLIIFDKTGLTKLRFGLRQAAHDEQDNSVVPRKIAADNAQRLFSFGSLIIKRCVECWVKSNVLSVIFI